MPTTYYAPTRVMFLNTIKKNLMLIIKFLSNLITDLLHEENSFYVVFFFLIVYVHMILSRRCVQDLQDQKSVFTANRMYELYF